MTNSELKPVPAAEITTADLHECTRILEAVVADCMLLRKLTKEDRVRLFMAAGRAIRPDQNEVRRRMKALKREENAARREMDRSVRAKTAIRIGREESVFIAPPRRVLDGSAPKEEPRVLQKPDACYICKNEFTTLHHFYDAMCPTCAEFNYEKRFQTCSLAGRVALITGARLKIGYQAALMMLRAGAEVIVTTRFPHDAAQRYSREADFSDWGHRLKVFGLDLRHSPSVEAFTRYIDKTWGRLDFLINNAAQTVRRPPGFYGHLLAFEQKPVSELPESVRIVLSSHEDCKRMLSSIEPTAPEQDGSTWVAKWHEQKGQMPKISEVLGVVASAELSQIPYACDDTATSELFPAGRLDADLQQVDLRRMNSWRMSLPDVPTAELLEVQLVNAIAPFILCSKLKPLMMRHPTGDKHIVNVSAMEGKFARHTKTAKHPHTNMAKAALNMMTLTSAREYARDGIFMNAVDTGWVTDEDPAELSARKQANHDFQPPLDIVDGAARVMDPIFAGIITGKHAWGNFLKDYVPTEW